MSLRGVAFPHKMFVYQQTNEAFTKDESLSTSKPRLRNSKVFRDTTNFRLNATNPIHKSEAVSKRKMELDQLRKRSLTKENGKETKKINNTIHELFNDKFHSHSFRVIQPLD